MSEIERKVVLMNKDTDGNIYKNYPVTKYDNVEGTPTLAKVATTGVYDDLTKQVGKSVYDTDGTTNIGEVFNDYGLRKANVINTGSYFAHAEGSGNTVIGLGSHAEGCDNTINSDSTNSSVSDSSHAEGWGNTINKALAAHVEGKQNTVSGEAGHAEGHNNTASGECSHAEGFNNINNNGTYSHVEGMGNNTKEGSNFAHAEGMQNTVDKTAPHAEGMSNTVTADFGHAEGQSNTVSAQAGHAEGMSNTVTADFGHAEGQSNTVSAQAGHAEGYDNTVTGAKAHAEGQMNTAGGEDSHVEGYNTKTLNYADHAEGHSTVANGLGYPAHAEGQGSQANNKFAHAQNEFTLANGESQTALGKWNVADETSAVIVGNGTASDARSNAYTLDWSGNVVLAGTVKANGTIADDSNDSTLATTKFVIGKIATITKGDNGTLTFSESKSMPITIADATINDYAFYNNTLLVKADLSHANIGNRAFLYCTALTTVNLPNLVDIGEGTFTGCNALTAISIPKIVSIGNFSFYSCPALPSISLPNTITSINTTAFLACSKLTSITIDRAQDAISGAPWGAPNATVTWTGTNQGGDIMTQKTIYRYVDGQSEVDEGK